MRLEELYLDGFGHFHQHIMGSISAPVTVFYGPNEAGKSTLLAFIRAILFGFPARFNGHYPPLEGGKHGGRVKLSNDAGIIYDVERYSGARGGLSVVTPSGPASDAETVLRQLTGAATSDLFKTVFAFSLDELQEAASLQGSSIYSTGQGVPRLPTLERMLSEKKGQIYLSKGNNQEVPKLLNTLKGVDEQLKAVEGNASRFGGLTARKLEIGRELQAADNELSGVNARRAEIASLRDGWDDWLALKDCETQLRDMPKFEQFPEDPIARLENLDERARQSSEDLEDAAEQVRLAGEIAFATILGENLLDDADSIEHIRRARNSFDDSVHDLPERQAELRGLKATFDKNLEELGHGWGEAELQAFDMSIVVRNQVDRWKQRLSESLGSSQQTKLRLEQDRFALEDLQSEAKEAREKLPQEPPPLDADALTERQDALRSARGRLSEYERERLNYETLRSQLNLPERTSRRPYFPLLIPLGLVGSALIVAGLVLGGDAVPMGIVGGVALLVAAFTLWYMGRPSPSAAPSPVASAMSQQTADAEMATEAARQSLLEWAAALGLAEQPNAAALDSVEARLELTRNALDTWTAATARVEETSRREKVQQGRVETATLEHEAAEAAALKSTEEWQQWLQARGLNKTLTADTMTTFLPRVDMTRASLAEAKRMGGRVAAIEHDIDEFREWVKPLALRHGIQLNPNDPRQLAAAADELIKRLDETRTSVSNRDRAKEAEEENRRRLERLEQRSQQVGLEITALLTAGGANNPEEFRRHAAQNEERMKLERQRDGYRLMLERLSGPGDKLDIFRESLANSDQNQLGEESGRLLERHAEVDARRNVLREERGGIDTELAQLTSEEESSALRIRRSVLLEQLREHAREWSRLTVAESLLEKTRQKFEQERQPSVIQHAQNFFSSVTGQRYNRLYAPIGEQTITVTDATGASRQPSELSRGTREQLYLALRFGLIREFGEHAERLPVVVDEVLVNFDPERARLAAESFGELAETNQVLVFTCHPATRDMFADVAGAQVVDIISSASSNRHGGSTVLPPT